MKEDGRGASIVVDGFDAFYQAYPRKKAPKDALKAWKALRPNAELQGRIMAALTEQRPELLARDPTRVPYPATWLRGEQWKNEPDPTSAVALATSKAAADKALLDEGLRILAARKGMR